MEVEVDTCILLVRVGRNTGFAQEVVVVYLYSSEVVLHVHPCLSVEPEVVVSAHFPACLGSLTSFSVFGMNLANVLASFTHWSLMCWQCLKSNHLWLRWLRV